MACRVDHRHTSIRPRLEVSGRGGVLKATHGFLDVSWKTVPRSMTGKRLIPNPSFVLAPDVHQPSEGIFGFRMGESVSLSAYIRIANRMTSAARAATHLYLRPPVEHLVFSLPLRSIYAITLYILSLPLHSTALSSSVCSISVSGPRRFPKCSGRKAEFKREGRKSMLTGTYCVEYSSA